ncbi:MAG: hypothetical protein MJ051_04105 [Akkermansia sp.]|nr:hypothetical protein [Akkermansia sp.]
MKLHLPFTLRSLLLSASAVACVTLGTTGAYGAIMHASPSLQTYADFGQNRGRYSVHEVNALLTHLNSEGIKISYTQGQDDYTLPHGLPSFESMVDGGFYTAVSPSFAVSVQHNGVPNPVFTSRYVGLSNAIHYSGIEYRSSSNNQFLLSPLTDYKATRLSKLITDITPSTLFDTAAHLAAGENIGALMQYRAGGGTMGVADNAGNITSLDDGYHFCIGGIAQNTQFYYQGEAGGTDNRGVTLDAYTIKVLGVSDYGPAGAGTDRHPLPFVTQGGDSGSPIWAWDEGSKSYQLIACHFGRIDATGFSHGAPSWTMDTMESFNKHVDMAAAGNEVHIGAVGQTEASQTYADATNGVSTTTKLGSVSGAAVDFTPVSFVGVENGVNTWLSLNALKDTDNWYSYDQSYLNAQQKAGRDLLYADLFMTESLVFDAASGSENRIVLEADADLGIGSVNFSRSGEGAASFTISSAANELGRTYMLNSAGYDVSEGVSVHLQLANTETDAAGNAYVREWRKIGAGDLYLEGQGNNEIFLNVGGSGTTYLAEHGGYAAYNVLINNGATVNLGGDAAQVARDVTFGNGGGVLDLGGAVQMEWNNANTPDGAFTIHALTQDGIIANTAAGATAELRYTESGKTSFLGSFADGNGASLKITYDGGIASSWTLNSIHTDLRGAESGLAVASGAVTLEGMLTVHGEGSATGFGTARYVNPEDWHYADARMNVTVAGGAAFTLGSHARLTGDITVEQGGTFVLNEGVKHQYEYVEGGARTQDTYQLREYYGLHGNVAVQGQMQVRFAEGTDSTNVLTGKLTGTGSLSVDTAQGTLVLSGENTLSGEKSISRGTVVAAQESALGDTSEHKWVVSKQAVLAAEETSAAAALSHVDTASAGVLALTQDESSVLNLNTSGHSSLIIGAAEGHSVQYGSASETLSAVNGKWVLGGGGGELVVNARLNDNKGHLVLGNEYGMGTVTLTNKNNLIGAIEFTGGVTLNFTSRDVLGGAEVKLDYTNRVFGTPGAVDFMSDEAEGVFLLDRVAADDMPLFYHPLMSLASDGDVTYTGNLYMAFNDTYHFGGGKGTLTLAQTLEDTRFNHVNLVVDGQTYSGGVTELLSAVTLTGQVTVMGYDAEKTALRTGDSTLRVAVDDALVTASGVTLKDGGILDIGDTTQHFTKLAAENGSMLTGTGKVELTVEEGATASVSTLMDVGNFTKNGTGTLLLGGSSATPLLTVAEGTVQLQSATALNAEGITHVLSGAVLDTFTGGANGNIVLDSGSTLRMGSGAVNGNVVLSAGTAQMLNAANASTSVGAALHIGEQAHLRMCGGTYVLTGSSYNAEGGLLTLEAKQMTFRNNVSVTVGGTLRADGSANEGGVVTLYSDRDNNNSQRIIEHLDVVAGTELRLSERTWNTIWNIRALTGEGKFTWNSGTTHNLSSRLILDGEGDFTGEILLNRTRTQSEKRSYQIFTELAHEKAVQNAVVAVQGANADNRMTLALNADTVRMQGLNGNEFAALYAGAALTSVGDTAPVSSREATLMLTGKGSYSYAGCILGGEGANGVSLVMDGAGKQVFTGDVNLRNLTVKQGEVNFSEGTPNITGDVTLFRGASLYAMAHPLVLQAGQTLALTGDASAASALSYTMQLNGASLAFDTASLSSESAALYAYSLENTAQTLSVSFSDPVLLRADTEYKLLRGFSLTGFDTAHYETQLPGDYLTASYTQSKDGFYDCLSVRFRLAEGAGLWHGTAEDRAWTGSHFGADVTRAVFNDSAAEHEVRVTENVHVAAAVVDSHQGYTFRNEGATATIGTFTQNADSATVLGAGAVRITGETLINGGVLTVQDTTTLAGAVSGEGTLAIDWDGQSGTVSGLGRIGTLAVQSGCYEASAAVNAGLIRVSEGGSFLVKSGTQTADMELSGAGRSSGADAAGALVLRNGTSVSGNITLAGDASVAVAKGHTGNLNGALFSDAAVLIKQGEGTLNIGQNASVSLAGLEVAQGTVQLTRNNTAEKNIGKLTMAGGTTFIQYSQVQPNSFMSIDSLELTGETATLQQNYNSGAISVGALTMAEGVESATLKLVNAAKSTRLATFELGGNGGNFKGTIELTSTDNGASRNAALTLNDASVAQHARIDLKSAVSSGAQLGLGIHADAVTVAGLSSGQSLGNRASVFSGAAVLNGAGFAAADADTVRTLTINTASGTDDSFYGTVGAKLNLVKDGAGAQRFLGTSDAFDGSLTVNAGTLALKDNAVKMLAQASSVALNGGTLELNFAADVTVDKSVIGEGSALVKKGAGAVSFTKSVTVDALELSGGAVRLEQDGAAATFTALNGTGSAGKLSLDANADGSLSVSGDGTVLEHLLIDLAEDTQLNLSDVVLASSSKLTDDLAFVQVNNVTLQAQIGVNTAEPVEVRAAESSAMVPSSGQGAGLSMAAGDAVCALTLTNVENVQLSGSHLHIELSGLEPASLAGYQWVSLTLSGEATFDAALDVTLSCNGATQVGYYRGEGGPFGTVYFESAPFAAPEPATATLSLLALMALAARRRRK